MMEYIVFFLLGITVGVGITYFCFPRTKILYKENTVTQYMNADHPANQQAPQIEVSAVKTKAISFTAPKKPEHSVIVYLESNESYTTFIANIDGILSTSNRCILTYELRDIINGHYLITYGEGLEYEAKNFIEALATTHLSRTLKTKKADYHISFEIRRNVTSLGLNDNLVSTQ